MWLRAKDDTILIARPERKKLGAGDVCRRQPISLRGWSMFHAGALATVGGLLGGGGLAGSLCLVAWRGLPGLACSGTGQGQVALS